MSVPTNFPSSFSKCHGAFVLPVPTRTVPRSSTFLNRLSDDDCAIASLGLSTVVAKLAAAIPNPPLAIMSLRLKLLFVMTFPQRSIVN